MEGGAGGAAVVGGRVRGVRGGEESKACAFRGG